MPKHNGGSRQKKMANASKGTIQVARQLPLRDKNTISDKSGEKDVQMYGQITQMLGNCHVQVKCHDGKDRRCVIRSGIKKKVRFFVDDVVLISLRSFQDDIADVLLKYTPEEVKQLKRDQTEAQLLETVVDTKKIDLVEDKNESLEDAKKKLGSYEDLWNIPEEPKEPVDLDFI